MGQQHRWKPLSWAFALGAPWLLVSGGCTARAGLRPARDYPPEAQQEQRRLEALPRFELGDAQLVWSDDDVPLDPLPEGQQRCLRLAREEDRLAWPGDEVASYNVFVRSGLTAALAQLPLMAPGGYLVYRGYACDESGNLAGFTVIEAGPHDPAGIHLDE